MTTSASNRQRILILGGGFGGVYAARHLEKCCRADRNVEITLVSRDNYFLMTPLLFEAASGVLEPRHAVNPIRPLLQQTQFVEAEVQSINLDALRVTVRPVSAHEVAELEYDHLILALGGITNTSLIPGAQDALTFKTLGDAIYLRNHVIKIFEQADVEKSPERKQTQLTFTVVGAGLVGLELMGELTTFITYVAKLYRNVNPAEIRFEMIDAGPRIAPELDEALSVYSAGVLARRGVRTHLNTRVSKIDGDRMELSDGQTIQSQTIVVATGVSANPLVKRLPLEKGPGGKIVTEASMQVKGRSNVWALGDCAAIPDPSGKPYPPLAQHALREAKCLAANVMAAIQGQPLMPFIYQSKGTLAALGHFKGAGRVYKFKIRGFVAWWVWRTYYLFQMPQWSRRLRIVIDWTVALFFRNDVVQLDPTRGVQFSEPTTLRKENASAT